MGTLKRRPILQIFEDLAVYLRTGPPLLQAGPLFTRFTMGKEIIVNASLAEEIRIAIKEDKKLLDLDFDNQSRAKHKGNIYKGIVSNIEDSLEAAFIEFGEDKQAFLPRSEIRPSLIPDHIDKPRNAKVSDILKRGQEVVVQVTKDEIGNKGAAVSTYLSLPGRYIVLMHSDESGGGISRKISDENSRRAARDMLSRLEVPDGMAVIIRTAGMEAAPKDLLRDFEALCAAWQQIDKGAQIGRAPTMLYREPDIVIRTIRDYFSAEVDKIVIDDEDEYNDALEYFKDRMPDLSKILFRHKKKEPIFHSFGIEEEIESLFKREVKLPSGGYVVIEQTEALVSVDVNSGSSNREEDHEATVYKTNLEAAEETARQLRLRDLGGIIVIDFIDMVSHRHRRDVEYRLRDAMYNDKARTKVGRISDNGTLELTRQRIRQSHQLISFAECPHCEGTGRLRDVDGLGLSALRRISAHLTKRRANLSKLIVSLPIDVANALNNFHRKDLVSLTEIHELEIEIMGDKLMKDSDLSIKEQKRGQAGLDAASRNVPRQPKGRQNKVRTDTQAPALPASIGPIPTLLNPEAFERGEVAQTEEESKDPKLTLEDPIYFALFGDVEIPEESTKESEGPRQPRERRPQRSRSKPNGEPKKTAVGNPERNGTAVVDAKEPASDDIIFEMEQPQPESFGETFGDANDAAEDELGEFLLEEEQPMYISHEAGIISGKPSGGNRGGRRPSRGGARSNNRNRRGQRSRQPNRT